MGHMPIGLGLGEGGEETRETIIKEPLILKGQHIDAGIATGLDTAAHPIKKHVGKLGGKVPA
jgi:hypothetical protein